jgi:hypothetical protein
MIAMKDNCEQYSEGLSLLAAGCVTEREEQELRGHVEGCAVCRERLSELQGVSAGLFSLRSAGDSAVVDVLLKRVVAELQPVVLKSVFSGTKRHVGLRGLGVFPVVVAVLLLLVSAGGLRFSAGPKAGSVAVAAERPLPGALTLTMAAVDSEQSLDLLLDRFADSGVLEPLSRPTFVQESLR